MSVADKEFEYFGPRVYTSNFRVNNQPHPSRHGELDHRNGYGQQIGFIRNVGLDSRFDQPEHSSPSHQFRHDFVDPREISLQPSSNDPLTLQPVQNSTLIDAGQQLREDCLVTSDELLDRLKRGYGGQALANSFAVLEDSPKPVDPLPHLETVPDHQEVLAVAHTSRGPLPAFSQQTTLALGVATSMPALSAGSHEVTLNIEESSLASLARSEQPPRKKQRGLARAHTSPKMADRSTSNISSASSTGSSSMQASTGEGSSSQSFTATRSSSMSYPFSGFAEIETPLNAPSAGLVAGPQGEYIQMPPKGRNGFKEEQAAKRLKRSRERREMEEEGNKRGRR